MILGVGQPRPWGRCQHFLRSSRNGRGVVFLDFPDLLGDGTFDPPCRTGAFPFTIHVPFHALELAILEDDSDSPVAAIADTQIDFSALIDREGEAVFFVFFESVEDIHSGDFW